MLQRVVLLDIRPQIIVGSPIIAYSLIILAKITITNLAKTKLHAI